MLKNILVGFGIAVMLGTAALAQTATPSVDPDARPAPSVNDQSADNGSKDDQQGGGWFSRKHRGHRMHGDGGPEGRGMGGYDG